MFFQIINAVHKLAAEREIATDKVYLWIDYHSVSQGSHAGVAQGVNALPLYVQCWYVLRALLDVASRLTAAFLHIQATPL